MNLTPDAYVKKFDDISPEMIKNLNGKAIFVDLDGTLASKNSAKPTDDVGNWINEMINEGIEVVILSNNNQNRVTEFSKDLGVPYFHKALKPTTKGLNQAFLALKGKYKKNNIIMIGDQIYTDTFGARNFGAKSIYVKPIDVNSAYVKFRTTLTEKPFLKKFKEF